MTGSRKTFAVGLSVALIVMLALSALFPSELKLILNSAYSLINNAAHPQRQGDHGSPLRIAVVEPVFTTTAYSSYYTFFAKHAGFKGVVRGADLALLNVSVKNGWGWSQGLIDFLSSGYAKQQGFNLTRNATILTDINVTEGALFDSSGKAKYDVVILGFEEYVTAQEYYAFKKFVAQGGTLIFMDATNFLAEVKYYPTTNHLALVRGKGWYFNGTAARPDVYERWRTDTENWVGSNYCCYDYEAYQGAQLDVNKNTTDPLILLLNKTFGKDVFTSYTGHEENRLTNLTDTTIIAIWQREKPADHYLIAAYIHRYIEGYVIHFGAMGSDIIASDRSAQVFLLLTIQYPKLIQSQHQGSQQHPTYRPVSEHSHPTPQAMRAAENKQPEQAAAPYKIGRHPTQNSNN